MGDTASKYLDTAMRIERAYEEMEGGDDEPIEVIEEVEEGEEEEEWPGAEMIIPCSWFGHGGRGWPMDG